MDWPCAPTPCLPRRSHHSPPLQGPFPLSDPGKSLSALSDLLLLMLLITINTSYWALVLRANMSSNPYSNPQRRQLPHLWTKHGGSKRAVTQLRKHEVRILTLQLCSLHLPCLCGLWVCRHPGARKGEGRPGRDSPGLSSWESGRGGVGPVPLAPSLPSAFIHSFYYCSWPPSKFLRFLLWPGNSRRQSLTFYDQETGLKMQMPKYLGRKGCRWGG